jgi:hypothetical protein
VVREIVPSDGMAHVARPAICALVIAGVLILRRNGLKHCDAEGCKLEPTPGARAFHVRQLASVINFTDDGNCVRLQVTHGEIAHSFTHYVRHDVDVDE